ncbi:MAG: hypothetical protein ACI959_001674 [Limisphaerales bacterium]|jgi:hypothetical protein
MNLDSLRSSSILSNKSRVKTSDIKLDRYQRLHSYINIIALESMKWMILLATLAILPAWSCKTSASDLNSTEEAKEEAANELALLSGDGGVIRITPSSDGVRVYSEFRSFSVVSAFSRNSVNKEYIYQDPQGVELIKGLGAHALRFPGGSFAGKFKPFEDKYAKLIDAHIKLSKETGITNCILVLNFLSGTVEEAKFVVKELKEGGINIIAVELGNEIHLKKYRKSITDVEAYVRVSAKYLEELKRLLPNAEFGIPVPSSRHVFDAEQMGSRVQFFEHWIATLSEAVSSGELEVDAVIPHFYKQTHMVYKLPTKFERFHGVMKEMRINSYDFLDQAVINYYDTHFSGLDLWITEWGLKEKQIYGNTLSEGLHVTSFLMDMMRGNMLTSNRITHSAYQKLHSRPSNGLISEVGTLPPVEPASIYKPETPWYAFHFINDIIAGGATITRSKISGVSQDQVRIETFRKGDDFYVLFANRTGKEYRINMAGTARYLYGDHPWSSNGMAFWHKDNSTEKYDPVKLVDGNITNVIQPWSFGYIKADWTKISQDLGGKK